MMEPKDNFRHKLIQEEFRNILTSDVERIRLNPATDAVMVLSAASLDEINSEDRARIDLGVMIAKRVVSLRMKKEESEVTSDDMITRAPILILNAETEQLPAFEKYVQENLGYPVNKIGLLNCGDGGVANTKTQFEVLKNHPDYEKLEHITIITSDYHVPRAARTAGKLINKKCAFDVIGTPATNSSNLFEVIRGEVKRIEHYSSKGDILR